MLSFLYNEIIVLFIRLALLCWCVYVLLCVFGRHYQAGSNQLSSEPLGDLAWWRACLLPMTRMISLLRGEGHTHTHTWANYCAVSLICHVEGVTQTCTTHKHKQTVTNANMPHFTHVRANAHKHTVSPPRPTHAYLYNLSQQALLLLKPTEPQTYWNWLYYFVLHILYNIMLMPFAFFLTQQLRSSICFLIEVICT